MFPMNIGSSGSAQIGGLIATNAGGCSSFRYGMMQDLVLGMEVVLSDGSIWNGMRAVQKDNTGYQLKKIFSGSEGTLGVITKAILKLSPKPKQCYTALLAIKDASALIEIKKQLRQEASEFLQAVEFFSDTGLEILLSNVSNINFPLKTRSPFYLLIEVGSSSEYVPLEKILSEIMEWGINKNLIMDGSLAMSISQQQNFWRLRDEQPEGQRRLGAQLKLDLSVPPGMLAHFLDHAATRCHKILPGVRINPFGHVGDGNVHYNLSPPVDQKDFLDLENELSEMLAELATDMRGSFAAEHGIGRSKIGLAKSLRCDIERKLMLNIKSSMDEANQLNPGVIVSKK